METKWHTNPERTLLMMNSLPACTLLLGPLRKALLHSIVFSLMVAIVSLYPRKMYLRNKKVSIQYFRIGGYKGMFLVARDRYAHLFQEAVPMFTEQPHVPFLNVPFNPQRPLLGIGLGGISEGWLPNVMLYHRTGILPFSRIILVDGKSFSDHNVSRQHFRKARNKAEDRREVWAAIYPRAPLYSMCEFVNWSNVSRLVRDGSIVLLSPDNHPTRVILSDHMETLSNGLLIVGGNDAVVPDADQNGTKGWVAVHCRVNGVNVTAPVTVYHDDLRSSKEQLPSEMNCVELAQAGQPQLLATNLFVGQMMSALVHRYLTLPLRQAVEVVEVCVDSSTTDICSYGIRERHLNTLFSGSEVLS